MADVVLVQCHHSSCCGITVTYPVVGLEVTEWYDDGWGVEPSAHNLDKCPVAWDRLGEAEWLPFDDPLEVFFEVGSPANGMMELRFIPLNIPVCEGFEELSCNDKGRLVGRVVSN